jgi:homoserine kinase type II
VAAADLPFFLGLMEHLAARSIPCPVPVAARDGKALRQIAGRPAAIVTYLEGLSVRKPRNIHCGALGRALASLHLAGADFTMRRANALGLAGFRPLYEQIAPRADSVSKNLAAELATELVALEQAWPRGLPEGVIHADLFPDNVLFIHDNLSGLIDFYFACNDAFAYDLAITMNAWCFEDDGQFNVTKARTLMQAYDAVRPLGAAEKKALPMLARGAALRFLLTRLYDWLTPATGALVKRKDPLEYLGKLRFHRGITDWSAYGL